MAWLPRPKQACAVGATPRGFETFHLCVRHEVAAEVRRQIGLGHGVTFTVHADDEVTVAPEVPPPTRPVTPLATGYGGEWTP